MLEDKLNSSSHRPNVAVILCYFEGHAFIEEQLKSIFDQTHKNIEIFLTDDCSKKPFDKQILNFSPEHLSKLNVHTNKLNKGFAENFLHSLTFVEEKFEFVAFSDQDDIWYENKLERAILALSKFSKNTPALYCARTEYTDAECKQSLGHSTKFKKPPSFENALIQSIGGGNTMVLNKSACELIKSTAKDTVVVSHDWWCYQVITGAGGIVIYDSVPCLKYRQHDKNLVGGNRSFPMVIERIRRLFTGVFKSWNGTNISALHKHEHLLTKQNSVTLKYFVKARQSGLIKRVINFERSGIHRQTVFENIALKIAVLFNKI